MKGSEPLELVSVSVMQVDSSRSEGVRVHLDSPKSASATLLTDGRLQIQGWVHPLHAAGSCVLVRSGDGVRSYDLNEDRQDVITAVLGGSSQDLPDKRCGFNFEVAAVEGPIEIGLKISDAEQWTWLISVKPLQKVLEGADGWLFLDNDSNTTVDQYTGTRLLSNVELQRWDSYFQNLPSGTTDGSPEWVFLLAPNKEYVFPDLFPKPRASLTPLDQFLNRYAPSESILWPLESFGADRHLAYWKGDTHWTDYGAALAAELILKRFGREFDGVVAAQPFICSKRAGDLGGKCLPKRINSVFDAAEGFITRDLVFDNGVHNHGRIRCYKRASANGDGTCLVMGDSFSVNLVPWLVEAFAEVIFVHTAAAYDPELICLVNPTHLVLQSNSRFIISPPDPNFSFWNTLRMKLAMPDVVSGVATSSADRTENTPNTIERAFNEFVEKNKVTSVECGSD